MNPVVLDLLLVLACADAKLLMRQMLLPVEFYPVKKQFLIGALKKPQSAEEVSSRFLYGV